MTARPQKPYSPEDAKAFYDESIRAANTIDALAKSAKKQKDAEERRQSLLAATNLTERQLQAIKLYLELY